MLLVVLVVVVGMQFMKFISNHATGMVCKPVSVPNRGQHGVRSFHRGANEDYGEAEQSSQQGRHVLLRYCIR